MQAHFHTLSDTLMPMPESELSVVFYGSQRVLFGTISDVLLQGLFTKPISSWRCSQHTNRNVGQTRQKTRRTTYCKCIQHNRKNLPSKSHCIHITIIIVCGSLYRGLRCAVSLWYMWAHWLCNLKGCTIISILYCIKQSLNVYCIIWT